MFNLSGSEIVVILLLALIVLGPDKLPEAMRKAGKTWAELRKLSSGFQEEVRKGFDEPTAEVRKTANTIKKAATLPKNPVKGAVKSLLDPPKTGTTQATVDTTATVTDASPGESTPAEAEPLAVTEPEALDADDIEAAAPVDAGDIEAAAPVDADDAPVAGTDDRADTTP